MGEPIPGQSGQQGEQPKQWEPNSSDKFVPGGPDAVKRVPPWSMGRPAEQPQQPPQTQVEIGSDAKVGPVGSMEPLGAKDLFSASSSEPALRPVPPAVSASVPATTEEFHAITGLKPGEEPLGVAVTQDRVDQYRKDVEEAAEVRVAAAESVKVAPPENLGVAIAAEKVEEANKELYNRLREVNREWAGGLVPEVATDTGTLLIYGNFGMHPKDGMVKLNDAVAGEIKRLSGDRFANPGPIELEDLEARLGVSGYTKVANGEEQDFEKAVEATVEAAQDAANKAELDRIMRVKDELEVFSKRIGISRGAVPAEPTSPPETPVEASRPDTLGFPPAPPIEPTR